MNTFFSGLGGSALLFLFTLVSGLFLSRSGNPYPTVIFNIHKLVAVGTTFIIVRNVYRLQQATAPGAFAGPAALLLTGLLFATLVVSGSLLSVHGAGLLTLQPSLLRAVHGAHQVAPLLALVVAGLSLAVMTGAEVASRPGL